MNYGTSLERKSLINGHVNEFPTKLGDTIAYHDLVNKLLYFHQKNKHGKDMVYSIDYDGNFLKKYNVEWQQRSCNSSFQRFLVQAENWGKNH